MFCLTFVYYQSLREREEQSYATKFYFLLGSNKNDSTKNYATFQDTKPIILMSCDTFS